MESSQNKNNKNNLDIAIKLDESIRYLLKSAKDFRKGNEDMADLIAQLSSVLDNVEKTLNIVEEKYYSMLERYKNGGEINPIILEKFVENLENLTHVLDNVEKITKNLNSEIDKHVNSMSKLDDTISKLKFVNTEISNEVISEFEKVFSIIKNNKEKLNELINKNQALENRLKELLLEIDSMIDENK
ncbi:hypothetical protein JH146_0937 [Methanocaldococcus bathoardescens]|uniref:Uncharacterized protein n=1 Tax=Methanocaldococcus bathoardescens TaxID=1301915 RepID=A0A076LFX7_9EURY|nr:hypothetical protein [Methanocaldococcus bathoardescens]AIJ05782.1 hypothetical protein JH146_0937 [Methanocaldococcus bathoardescens]